MKKTFELTDPKLRSERKIEMIKGQINKYIKRERRKNLPDGFDFWDFDCYLGDSIDTKKNVHIAEIPKFIDDVYQRELKSFYIELTSSPRKRLKKQD